MAVTSPYDPSAVVSKTGGGVRTLGDANPLVVVEGAAVITATGEDLLYAGCDNRVITSAWAVLTSGNQLSVGAGQRMAVMRANPAAGTPIGIRFS